MSCEPLPLELPLNPEAARELRAGQTCLLSGTMYTLRDAGHVRLLAQLESEGSLPYGLAGQTIFYAGPTPPRGDRPFGAIGPTTASRMDFATPALMRAGLIASVGKGVRGEAVRQACIDNGGVYFVATGGAAALLARCIESAQTIAYEDLGTEALRKIEVKDFPVFVGIDATGASISDDEGQETSRA